MAYIPEHLGGEDTRAKKPALQVESAILLSEDGTPRCRIGKNPSEYLSAEKLDEFRQSGLEIGAGDLDALQECDESDELYARMILGTEEISLGMAAPPGFIKGAEFVWEAGRVAAPVLAIGFFTGCLPVKMDDLFSVDMSVVSAKGYGIVLMGLVIWAGGIAGSAAIISKIVSDSAIMGWALGISGAFGASAGLVICGDN